MEVTVSARVFAICSAVYGKETAPAIPRVRNGGVCIALAGNFSRREAIHITLQDFYWIVSIAWILVQAIYMFNTKKK